MSTFVFEVESGFEWTEEKVATIINAIEAEGPTVMDEYPLSDDDILLDAISKDTGMNITNEDELFDALNELW